MRAMMEQEIEPRLLGPVRTSNVVCELEFVGQEARLFVLMRDVEARCVGVKVGSYPQDDKGRVILRLQGPPAAVESAATMMRAALPDLRRVK
jgi:molybdopterin-biosynthesis enzyme MoeA-like protein